MAFGEHCPSEHKPCGERNEHAPECDRDRARTIFRDLAWPHFDPGKQEQEEDSEISDDFEKRAASKLCKERARNAERQYQGDHHSGHDLAHRRRLTEPLCEFSDCTGQEQQKEKVKDVFH